MTLLLIMYCLFGAFVGTIFGAEAWSRADTTTGEDAAPALGFIAGLVWPVTGVALVCWGLFAGGRTVGRSFAVLWREYVA